jgi:hypothetical protein
MLEIIRFRRSSSFTMDAFTHMLESQMSVAQIGCGFPDHLCCVRPNMIVEVAMITCSDRLRTLDNRYRGLIQKVKIWAFWTGQNRKIFLKFIRMKSGQHPKPKISSGLCIRPPKLEKLSGPAHQASKKGPRSLDDTLKAY